MFACDYNELNGSIRHYWSSYWDIVAQKRYLNYHRLSAFMGINSEMTMHR